MAVKSLRERKKEACFQEIFRQAFRLFIEKGYDNTTVDEIAEAAGVSKVTLFKYYPRKDAIILHLFQSNVEKMEVRYLEIEKLEGLSSEEKLRMMIGGLVSYYETVKPAMKVSIPFFMQNIHSQGADRELPIRRLLNVFMREIAQGQARGEFRTDLSGQDLGEYFFHLSAMVLFQWVKDQGELGELMDRMLKFYLQGLKGNS